MYIEHWLGHGNSSLYISYRNEDGFEWLSDTIYNEYKVIYFAMEYEMHFVINTLSVSRHHLNKKIYEKTWSREFIFMNNIYTGS